MAEINLKEFNKELQEIIGNYPEMKNFVNVTSQIMLQMEKIDRELKDNIVMSAEKVEELRLLVSSPPFSDYLPAISIAIMHMISDKKMTPIEVYNHKKYGNPNA